MGVNILRLMKLSVIKRAQCERDENDPSILEETLIPITSSANILLTHFTQILTPHK